MSTTTREVIRNWLEQAKAKDATHLLVICDTFDYEDYPVYVAKGQTVGSVAREYHGLRMQKVMECYDLSLDWDKQLSETRAWHGWRP